MPGAFVEGEWKTERQWKNTDGRFVRATTSFRDWISADGSSGFPAEAGRYHLYIAWACPWAHRTAIMRRLKGLEGLWGYTKDLYQQPGVAETVNMDHIKKHYYVSHESINPTRIVPKGPVLDFDEPHDRWRFSG